MGKRGNDNAQLTKEEYEALEDQGGGSSAGNDSFKKASAETLRGRRIIKTSRKWKAAKADAAPAPAAKSAFAGFTFGGATTTAAPAAPTGKPLFAMPTLPVPTFPASSGSAAPVLAKKAGGDATQQLNDKFKDFLRSASGRDDMKIQMMQFAHSFLAIKNKDVDPSATAAIGTKEAEPTTKPLFPSASSNKKEEESTTKPLFPPATNASAPVPFSFSAPASGSGFSFSLGTTPAPVTITKPVDAPVEQGGEEEETEGPTVLESADKDWNLQHAVNVKVYNYKTGVPKAFAKGELKIQESKENSKVKRMVLRDAAGKVMVNISISSDMKFEKLVEASKKGRPPKCRVVFYGINGVTEKTAEPEMFTIMCKQENLDAFHSKLEAMAQASK